MDDLIERLKDLEAQYEECEDEKERLLEEIENIKSELNNKGIACDKVNIKMSKIAKPVDISINKYKEFFKIAKSVIVDKEDDAQLLDYLDKNNDVKERVIFIFNIIAETDNASISSLQRYLQIGYCKAAEIVELLKDIGIITSIGGVSAKKIKKEQLLKLKRYLNIEIK